MTFKKDYWKKRNKAREEAASSKPQAPSLKHPADRAPSCKHQAPSGKPQA